MNITGRSRFAGRIRKYAVFNEEEGLSEPEADAFAVLDVKPAAYFTARGVTNQHGGGGRLFSRDRDIMGWLFGEHKNLPIK
uniref:hypothetical protein n=1 Tax=Enterocloster clostridioformis TaxID=1531 RepID=UPI001F3802B2|nr:hypothetical protein [Enterocloster clostridioformis]